MPTNIMIKKASEHMNFCAHTRNTAIPTDKGTFSDSLHDQCDYMFSHPTGHSELRRACNVNVCVLKFGASEFFFFKYLVSSIAHGCSILAVT